MIVGILLAAGSATRFGGNKLLAELTPRECVVDASCARLRSAVDLLIAVVRPDAVELGNRLAAAGAEVRVFPDARDGMGASLAFGVTQAPDADGWLVGLGDMPFVVSEDVRRVVTTLRAGAAIVVPVADGRRGHPVGFARRFFHELTGLTGDAGARSILARHAADITEIPAVNGGICRDIDTPADLDVARRFFADASGL